jgi:Aminomethyltransferase folate-binding domain
MALSATFLRGASCATRQRPCRIGQPALARRGMMAAAAAPSSSEPLIKTSLYQWHKDAGGDMVPFAGYELPVLYKGENGGVMKEHLWCRSIGKSSLFDVSHMGQVSIRSCQAMAPEMDPTHIFHPFSFSPRFAGMEKIVWPLLKKWWWATLVD